MPTQEIEQRSGPPCSHLNVDVVTPLVVQCRACGVQHPMGIWVDGKRVVPVRFEGWDAKPEKKPRRRTTRTIEAPQEQLILG